MRDNYFLYGQPYPVPLPQPDYPAQVYDEPPPGPGSLKDTPDYPYGAGPAYPPPPVPNGYALSQPLPPPGHCLRGSEIQQNLMRNGWSDFSDPQKGADVVGLTARRPNGLSYRLKLDRCTGIVLQAYLLNRLNSPQTYSYEPGPVPPGSYEPSPMPPQGDIK
jgi:hypothetical protein